MSGERFVQGSRQPGDGAIWVHRHNEGNILIAHADKMLLVSEYNAARILASLALILGVRINREDAKAIKL